MPVRFSDPTTSLIAAFLLEIGLPIRADKIAGATILPGIRIENGGLIADETRLTYPGDLLHEAGHLAVTPAERRCSLNDDTGDDGGEEMAAIAWSYAAALHLDLDPAIVFHTAGYRDGAAQILSDFREGRYFGVPFLQWIGLTDSAYPRMLKWLRD